MSDMPAVVNAHHTNTSEGPALVWEITVPLAWLEGPLTLTLEYDGKKWFDSIDPGQRQ